VKQPLPKILIIDDDADVLTAAKLLLKQVPYDVRIETNPAAIPSILKTDAFDVILLDMNFTQDVTSGAEGFFWLKEILKLEPCSVVLLITAYGDVETAVKAVKEGATDFVLKPWQNEKLLATLASAVKLSRSQVKVKQLEVRQEQLIQALDHPFEEMIGRSPAMAAVYQTIDKVAKTDASVLILGENGTGKELVARALHRKSNRGRGPFIGIDMGAVPETLFESELFGHAKGAFTDARSDRAGKFEAADGGTLFLDEIGNLSLPMQAKLLRALDTRQAARLGSNRPSTFDVRLICATNRPIHQAAADGTFRQDFLYRINTVEIRLPPLRDRREDIPHLARFFIGQVARRYNRPTPRIEAEAMDKLLRHPWPGNVRELKHTIERTLILNDAPVFTAADFVLSATEPVETETGEEHLNLADTEKRLLIRALDKHHGNVSRAARELGLTRTALYRRMEKHGL
jgi:DNA-binding NtrC family response regulator